MYFSLWHSKRDIVFDISSCVYYLFCLCALASFNLENLEIENVTANFKLIKINFLIKNSDTLCIQIHV